MTAWRVDPQGVTGVLERIGAASTDLAVVASRATDTCVDIIDTAGDVVIATELVAFVETYTALTAAHLARVASVAAAAAEASTRYEAGDAQMARDTLTAAQAAWGWTS